jgi:hypothetical protein
MTRLGQSAIPALNTSVNRRLSSTAFSGLARMHALARVRGRTSPLSLSAFKRSSSRNLRGSEACSLGLKRRAPLHACKGSEPGLAAADRPLDG